VIQLNELVTLTTSFVWLHSATLVFEMQGQVLHGLWHGFILTVIFLGFCMVGDLALQMKFFRFVGCLKATIGEWGNTFDIFVSFVIVFLWL
jgi:hypothetical protein